jgi:hypothetical protein
MMIALTPVRQKSPKYAALAAVVGISGRPLMRPDGVAVVEAQVAAYRRRAEIDRLPDDAPDFAGVVAVDGIERHAAEFGAMPVDPARSER